jgi:hypothetical protein
MKKSAFQCVAVFALALIFFAGFVLMSGSPVRAQSTYGTVSGSVVDSSGAAIAAAQVTLTNLGTSEKRIQSVGSDGLYEFVNLFPGRYRVDVEKAGFKRISHTDVVVELQQTSRIDLVMQVGEVTQTVEVSGETPQFQPETSSLGQVIEQRKANELPLNGRNVFNLALLSPSVIPQGNSTGTPVGKNPFDLGNYQIGGSFANEGAEYLDGQPLNIGYINLPLVVPTQDSIGEFKVQYSNLGPEWGKFAGGVINFSTKSGTNTWHGSAYDYLRNKVFNSNETFLKASELAKGAKNEPPPFTQNQFGATVGGKIKKDKTFVFGSYEGFRLRTGTVFTTTVPTAAERGGDFSGLCSSGFTGPAVNGVNTCADTDPKTGAFIHQLYDPLSVNPLSGSNQRTPFAGNLIPTARLNSSSLFLLGLIAPPTNAGLTNNFTKATSTGGDIDEYVGRMDHNITDKQHIFGRFTYFKQLSLAQDPFGTGLCKDRCAENTRSKSIAVGYTYAIKPTVIAGFNISASRFHYLRLPINANFDVTKEGWPAAYNPAVPNTERTPLTPCFGVSDTNITCSQGQSAIDDHDTQWNLSPQMTVIRGRHTFTFGGQLEEGYDDYLQTNTGGGLISFNGSWTQSLARNAAGATGGLDFADFLLGYGLGAGAQFGNQTTGSLVISGPVAGKQTYRALYFGDTWHVNNKLTVNLGLRYELQGPWSERHDRLTFFDPTATNAAVTGCSGVAGSACKGDLFLVKTGANSGRNSLPLHEKEFSPRLGVAYALNQKTVLRAGYGVFFIPNFVSFGTNPYIDPVSSATSPFFASNNQGLFPASTLNQSNCTLAGAGGAANFSCAAPGPFGPTLVPVAGRNPAGGISVYGINQTALSATGYTVQKPGYVEQYNFDIQRELPWGIFADVAYAGSHGVHLPQFNSNINQIPDSFIAQAATQYNPALANPNQNVTIAQPVAAYPFSANLPGGLSPTGLIQGQLDRPFPQYGGLNLNGFGCCSSNYNSLQVSVSRRFSGGGTILVAYTNAKLLSNTDTLTSWLEGGNGGVGGIQDWNNLKGERSLSSQDVPQRLVISYVLDLPFGKGKRFMGDASGAVGRVVSGWGLDGVTSFQRGFPLKFSVSGGTPLSALGLGIGGLRPDVVPGCDKGAGGHHVAEWFNTACFAPPPAYGFGNESRVDSTLRLQGINNFDWAVFKKTSFGPDDRLNIEFRTEFFNLFNHAQFGAPNTAFGSNTFGQVSSTLNQPRLIQFGLKFAF